MSHDKPLISPESAVYLAQIINRVAASFDAAELSTEEAVELFTLLDRLTTTLWNEHTHTLLPLYESILERLGIPVAEALELLDDDELDDDELDDDELDDDESGGSGGKLH